MSLIWGSVTLQLYLWLTKIPNDKYAVPHCLPIRIEYLVIFRWGRLQTLSGRPGGLKKAVGCHNLRGRTRPVAIHSLVGRTPGVRRSHLGQSGSTKRDQNHGGSRPYLQSTSKKFLWQPISVQLGSTKRDRNHGGSRPYLN